jgi:hypothetical protein
LEEYAASNITGSSTFFRNVDKDLPNYTASHPRKQQSSESPQSENSKSGIEFIFKREHEITNTLHTLQKMLAIKCKEEVTSADLTKEILDKHKWPPHIRLIATVL